MKVQEITDTQPWSIIINEVFDTKIPTNDWQHIVPNRTQAIITIDNDQYQVYLDAHTFDGIADKQYNFINVGFTKLVNGKPSENLTLTNRSASKVIGAISNAIFDQLKNYNYDAVVFIARDNIKKRMSLYNSIARLKLGINALNTREENIVIPDGMATIIFNNTFTEQHYQIFKQYLQQHDKSI